jgi:hypothetical protein
LLAHLEHQRDLTRVAVADYVFDGQEAKARIATGGLRVLEQTVALFYPPEPLPQEEEEPFVDPGSIPPPPRGAVRT